MNVVVLCLDSVRKDFFDEYANRIRERSTVSFERCRAASSWSTPSHASMISGWLPSEHGIHTHNRHFRSLPREETVFGDLNGHTALGVSSNVFAGPPFGFDEYFDEFDTVTSSRRFRGLNPGEYLTDDDADADGPRLLGSYLADACRSDHTVKSILNAGVGGLNLLTASSSLVPKLFDKGTKPLLRRSIRQIEAAGEPFISFCNLMEGHVPHTPIRGYDSSFYPDLPDDWTSEVHGVWELCDGSFDEYWTKREQVYAAVVDYLDRHVASFIDRVEEITDATTTVIVTSDHGDNHGRASEHGMANHVASLSEGVIRVPFEVVNSPAEALPALKSIADEPTSHLQLRELVVKLGRETHPRVEPVDVIPSELIGRAETPEPPSREAYWDRAQRCCIRGNRKVLWDSQGRVRQYELDPASPSWQAEVSDLDAVPAWAANQFSTGISEYKSRAKQRERNQTLDEAVRGRLEDLGYAD